MNKNTPNHLAQEDASFYDTAYVWDAYPERWALLIAEGQRKDNAEVVAAANRACAAKQIRQRAEYHLANADAALKAHNGGEADLRLFSTDALLATMSLEEAQRQELRANLSFRKALLVKASDFHVTH